MPSTSAALLLRALVLCTIHTAITAIAVVPVDGFLTGKSTSRSLENARRTEFRVPESKNVVQRGSGGYKTMARWGGWAARSERVERYRTAR